jgi:hypothetical protein
VKSVSTLWAVADPSTAAAIERAHRAAVADALRFIEEQALFTRTGPHGIRQVNVHGLVAAAFTHRDSRAGDPDLHTHVAVANKVQTLDGRLSARRTGAVQAKVRLKPTTPPSNSTSATVLGCDSPNGCTDRRSDHPAGRRKSTWVKTSAV